MKYLVTAAYKDVVDAPQVYETVVEADSPEHAETLARRQAVEDNGGDPNDPGEYVDGSYALEDVFARPASFDRDAFDIDGIKAALEGESNDAEHDALAGVADTLGIRWEASW